MTVDVEATMPRPGGHDAEESSARIKAKLDLWAKVIRDAKIAQQ
jgi:hypothetical protein